MCNQVVILMGARAALFSGIAGAQGGGSKVCAGCHREIWETYRRTGMARSFYRLLPEDMTKTLIGNTPSWHQCRMRRFHEGLAKRLSDWPEGKNQRPRGSAAPVDGAPCDGQTHIEGYFNLDLGWTVRTDAALDVRDSSREDRRDQWQSGVDGSDLTIFEALEQQLGLRLEAKKGPIEALVIDHVERPSAN